MRMLIRLFVVSIVFWCAIALVEYQSENTLFDIIKDIIAAATILGIATYIFILVFDR